MANFTQLRPANALAVGSIVTSNGAAKNDLSNVTDADLKAALSAGLVVNAVSQGDTSVLPSGASVWAVFTALSARIAVLEAGGGSSFHILTEDGMVIDAETSDKIVTENHP